MYWFFFYISHKLNVPQTFPMMLRECVFRWIPSVTCTCNLAVSPVLFLIDSCVNMYPDNKKYAFGIKYVTYVTFVASSVRMLHMLHALPVLPRVRYTCYTCYSCSIYSSPVRSLVDSFGNMYLVYMEEYMTHAFFLKNTLPMLHALLT